MKPRVTILVDEAPFLRETNNTKDDVAIRVGEYEQDIVYKYRDIAQVGVDCNLLPISKVNAYIICGIAKEKIDKTISMALGNADLVFVIDDYNGKIKDTRLKFVDTLDEAMNTVKDEFKAKVKSKAESKVSTNVASKFSAKGKPSTEEHKSDNVKKGLGK